ncbi:hypothetical protein [Stieleria varia]|nr:hypothetical protein [Stieleria varia]
MTLLPVQSSAQESRLDSIIDQAGGNEHLAKLRAARDGFEKANRATAESSAFGKQLHAQILDIYALQIEKANGLIAEGKPFGASEYDSAMKAVQEEIRRSAERMKKGMADNRDERAKIDRETAEKISQARQKYGAAMDASRDEFQKKMAIADLKYKFSVNRGDLGVVIWNLPPDRSLHNRSSMLVNLRLYLGDQVVFDRKGVSLNRRFPRNPIPVSRVMFDRVEIEIPKWNGEGVGLAEVEVIIGNENVALGRPCKVSSIETLPIHLDDENALTDRITIPKKEGEGYWIAEAKTAATITIDLLGPKHSSVAQLDEPVNAGR